MTALFISILNMSITASYVALAVIIIRLLLKQAPKIYSYVLWLAVILRLVIPYSVNAPFSFLNFLQPNVQATTGVMEFIPSNIGLMDQPAINLEANDINHAINSLLPPATPLASANPLQIVMDLAGLIWIIGMVILLICSVVSYLKVKNNLKTATLVTANIYETDRIITPFVCGFMRPKIYIPLGLKNDELTYILEHEQTHIHRRDYLIKPFAFLVLIVHWFNPILWISFALMSRDMEMSCDERVIRKMGNGVKAGYSNALLSFSKKSSRFIVGSPLAFGESQVHSRIKNILSYKKPTLWLSAVISVVTLMLIIFFTINPAKEQIMPDYQINQLAADWANALKTREGKPRYDMMTEEMKEKFIQEQISRSGDNWNYNIGVSSPWVVDFDVHIEGDTATITYLTKTSEPATYQTEEKITFANDNGKIVVVDYKTMYEDRLVERDDTAEN